MNIKFKIRRILMNFLYVIRNKYKMNIKLTQFKTITININTINMFDDNNTRKECNDINNKTREIIIEAIINRKIIKEWYKVSVKWYNVKTALNKYISSIGLGTCRCIRIGGRNNNYDFDISDDTHTKHIEFKFGTTNVVNYPQIICLSAKYWTTYIEYFYTNYIHQIAELFELVEHIPTLEEYNKYISNTNYHKHVFFQKLYENETLHKYEKKQIVETSINKYLSECMKYVKIQEIFDKLRSSQANKEYMCFKHYNIYYDTIHQDELEFDKIAYIKNNNTIVANTKNINTDMHILLRWKNHIGILNPALQIKIVRH